MVRAYVGLGANLGDREATLRTALGAPARAPDVDVVAVSALRETEPVGYADQPRFLNAAAAVDTASSARELLDLLLAVERELGRTREGPRFGPRTIDLDLLLHGDAVIDEPGLTVPHPAPARASLRAGAAGWISTRHWSSRAAAPVSGSLLAAI